MFDYTVRKNHKAKRMRITVHRDGSVVLTIPKRGNMDAGERFVHEKREWVENKLAHMKERMEKSASLAIPRESRKDFEEKKGVALELAIKKLQTFNAIYGLAWKRVSIKDLKTRWGSCSKLGNLNFSYKIVYLPENLANYLVVHELCHLQELNHSPRFWKLVEKAVPDYKILRRELRGI